MFKAANLFRYGALSAAVRPVRPRARKPSRPRGVGGAGGLGAGSAHGLPNAGRTRAAAFSGHGPDQAGGRAELQGDLADGPRCVPDRRHHRRRARGVRERSSESGNQDLKARAPGLPWPGRAVVFWESEVPMRDTPQNGAPEPPARGEIRRDTGTIVRRRLHLLRRGLRPLHGDEPRRPHQQGETLPDHPRLVLSAAFRGPQVPAPTFLPPLALRSIHVDYPKCPRC